MTDIKSLLPTPVLDLYNAFGIELVGVLSLSEKFPHSEGARRLWWWEAFYDQQYDFIAINETSMLPFARLALHELIHWTGHPNRLGRQRMMIIDLMMRTGMIGWAPIPTVVEHTEEAIAEMGMLKLTKVLGLYTPMIQDMYERYLTMFPLADLYVADIESDRAVRYIVDQMQNRISSTDWKLA